MTKEQAEALAAKIRTQLPFHIITVAQSIDMRNAPRNWFLGIKPSGEWTESMLIIQSQYDWQNALLAWRIIGA